MVAFAPFFSAFSVLFARVRLIPLLMASLQPLVVSSFCLLFARRATTSDLVNAAVKVSQFVVGPTTLRTRVLPLKSP